MANKTGSSVSCLGSSFCATVFWYLQNASYSNKKSWFSIKGYLNYQELTNKFDSTKQNLETSILCGWDLEFFDDRARNLDIAACQKNLNME